jgi:hypothetical protein
LAAAVNRSQVEKAGHSGVRVTCAYRMRKSSPFCKYYIVLCLGLCYPCSTSSLLSVLIISPDTPDVASIFLVLETS